MIRSHQVLGIILPSCLPDACISFQWFCALSTVVHFLPRFPEHCLFPPVLPVPASSSIHPSFSLSRCFWFLRDMICDPTERTWAE
jgi:hypothetical protein